jgi:enoyl-CoA hydratase
MTMQQSRPRVPDGYQTILVASDGPLVTLTLNRPEVRNAIDLQMVREIHHLLDALQEYDEPGVMVVTGAGGQAFAAGADIAQLRERDREDALRGINSNLFARIEEFPWPTIAAIEGYALGGGCELAMAMDLRVAAETARLGQPEVGLGIIPGAGATRRLPRLVGLGRAKELVLTGDIIGARDAERIGLVTRVVPAGKALEEAQALAWRILKQDPLALRISKMLLNAWVKDPSSAVMEQLGQAVLFESEGKRQRMDAFLSKKRRSKE